MTVRAGANAAPDFKVGLSVFRKGAVLGLLVLAMFFAPLGQGVGLSAGQGVTKDPQDAVARPAAEANALAMREVERLAARS